VLRILIIFDARIRILSFTFIRKRHFARVEDPHHFNADPDPASLFKADLDPAFHFDGEQDLDLHQSNGNLQPLTLHFELSGLHFKPPSLHSERPWPSKALVRASPASKFDFNAKPAFHSNADPDPASKKNADPGQL
jgi:hypothetical protein